jgi:hypothetical protein
LEEPAEPPPPPAPLTEAVPEPPAPPAYTVVPTAPVVLVLPDRARAPFAATVGVAFEPTLNHVFAVPPAESILYQICELDVIETFD